MKIFRLYIPFLSLVFVACNFENHNQTHTLSKQLVYVVQETDHSLPKQTTAIRSDTSYVEYIFQNYDLVNIKSLDSSIRIDLRYASTNNFMKYNLYDGLSNAYFNCETALKICAAQFYLKQINPALSLLVLDASRPQHIQQMMWDSLKMHPDKKQFYLSKPEETSMHNYGCAVDATIYNETTNKVLDMGTDFDFFGKLSEPIYETHFIKTGELSREPYQNRLLLRKVMLMAKLNAITSEWWHFSLCKKEEAIARFKLIK